MQIQFQSILSAGFREKTMFHPKAACFPDGRLIMTLQEIGGSDYYGPVLHSYSDDNGYNWSKPEAIPPFGWQERGNGVFEGVCDTVPDFDPASGLMVAIGHNVFYRDNRFFDTLGSWDKADRDESLKRRGVYSVRLPDGKWTDKEYFNPPEFSDCVAFCCGCSQKVILPDGTWLIPFYYMRDAEEHSNRVTVFRALFDGRRFEMLQHGDILEHFHGRGLLEPSLIRFGGKIHLTLRAEDGKAWHTVSDDGLHYAPLQPWRMDDGREIESSTTQQHWLELNGKLYLSYTRNAGYNGAVFRFRAPLFLAEVDPARGCLLRATERVVLPVDGDWAKPETVALSGNFMPVSLGSHEALICDGSCKPFQGYTGITMIARIKDV